MPRAVPSTNVLRWMFVLCCGCNRLYGLDETRVILDARTCTTGTQFGTPVEVGIDPYYSVEAARFTRNRGVAYLSLCPPTNPKDGCNIYTSVYSAETEQFGAFSIMGGVSDPAHYDSYPTITNDNRHLLFGSSRSGAVNIFYATVMNSSFDTPTITKLVTGTNVANEPYVVGNGRVLYFGGQSNGDNALYRMEGEPPTFGGRSDPVEGTAQPGYAEFAPVVRDDELEVFFAAGTMSLDNLAIYSATRDASDGPFSSPTKLDLPAGDTMWPVWISPSGCDLYFISRVANKATLYVTKR